MLSKQFARYSRSAAQYVFCIFQRKQRINSLYSGKLESRGVKFKFINKRTNSDFIISTTEANFLAFNQKLRMLAAATVSPMRAFSIIFSLCRNTKINIVLKFRMEMNQIEKMCMCNEMLTVGSAQRIYFIFYFDAIWHYFLLFVKKPNVVENLCQNSFPSKENL